MLASEADRVVPVNWASGGACRDADPELFFPVASSGPALHQVAEAKATCVRCLVITDCLRYALTTGQEGIWGGTTEQERKALRARQVSRLPGPWGS